MLQIILNVTIIDEDYFKQGTTCIIAPICWSKYTTHYVLTIVGGLRTVALIYVGAVNGFIFSSKPHIVQKAYFSINTKN